MLVRTAQAGTGPNRQRRPTPSHPRLAKRTMSQGSRPELHAGVGAVVHAPPPAPEIAPELRRPMAGTVVGLSTSAASRRTTLSRMRRSTSTRTLTFVIAPSPHLVQHRAVHCREGP